MGRRLAGWRVLSWSDRGRLLACITALPLLHASLAVLGYTHTRRAVESLSRHRSPRPATPDDIAAARNLARLAAIAGHHGLVRATCLRQSLLLYAWLRRRGLAPCLQLGLRPDCGPTEAHAWVELDGQWLLQIDAGHQAFHRPSTPL